MMSERTAIATALKANKEHQHALKAYTERLEADLKTVDKMIAAIDSDDDTEDVADTSLIYVEGAVKPVSVVLPRTLLSEDSPFYEDAQWRKRYEEYTTVNQMKAKEHDALREAVRIENMRMFSLDAQSRNQPIDVKSFPPEHFEQNTEGIDWRRVAVQISSSIPSAIPRTPKECEIRWLGHLHRSINQSPWTPQETERLRSILADIGTEISSVDWLDISKRLGTNRTPIDCMRHGMTRRQHTWTPEADRKLSDAVELYGQNNWQLVAMNVSEDVTAHQCQKRYLDSLDPSIKSGPWTPEEDEKLRRAIIAFAGPHTVSDSNCESGGTSSSKTHRVISWQDVALFVPGRTNNQCREHYQDSIVKSKNKGKRKSARGGAKGKGKAVVRDEVDDGEEGGSESNTNEEGGRDVAPPAGHHESSSQPKTNEKHKTKADEHSDQVASDVNRDLATPPPDNSPAVNGTEGRESQIPHTEASTLRPRPRPRPRRKVNTIIESMRVEGIREPGNAQPQPTIVQDDAVPSPSGSSATTPRNTSGTRSQSPKGRDVHILKGTLTKPSKAPKKRKAAIPLSTTEDVEPPSNEDTVGNPNDDREQIAATLAPASKKRKPAGRPRKNTGPPIHDAAPDESGPSDGNHVPVGLEAPESNTPVRRSSRLTKAKR